MVVMSAAAVSSMFGGQPNTANASNGLPTTYQPYAYHHPQAFFHPQPFDWSGTNGAAMSAAMHNSMQQPMSVYHQMSSQMLPTSNSAIKASSPPTASAFQSIKSELAGVNQDSASSTPPSYNPAATTTSSSAVTSTPTSSATSIGEYPWMRYNTGISISFTSSGQRILPTGAGTNNVRVRTREKYRMVYSDQQRLELEKEFMYNGYITQNRKTELSQNLGLTERQIKIWFQNRRAKQRKVRRREETKRTGCNVSAGSSHHDSDERDHDDVESEDEKHQHCLESSLSTPPRGLSDDISSTGSNPTAYQSSTPLHSVSHGGQMPSSQMALGGGAFNYPFPAGHPSTMGNTLGNGLGNGHGNGLFKPMDYQQYQQLQAMHHIRL